MAYKRITAAEAAAMIRNGENIGLSGFTPAGTAKAVTKELAKKALAEHEAGREFKVGLFTGASTGQSADGDLSNAQAIKYRAPYTTNGDFRRHVNAGEIAYNDICDSARGCSTHGGVSRFGEKVIAEMNRQGIMVDLSHAAEKSFYDALDISSDPIVCSHSNCKALCDVPRNLSDDQLRALAARGGVAHITLYHGFLRNDGREASIMDALAHLEHAVKIMGVEHVGLGTDFDGDGGVRGLADSSEMINFTIQLLRRRYNERDIARIWGCNWLRVMAKVQSK